MSGENDVSPGEKNVPRGRLARIFGIGKLAAGLAGDLAGAAGKLAAGKISGGEGREAAEERFHRKAAERMFSALGRMKGLPMKLGQMLSYIDDFIPPAYRDIYSASLRKLQVKAHPMRWTELETVIEQDLGAKPERLFAQFTREPIAAASIGQVYRATLADGSDVAVKVQYPGIGQAIQNDLKNIHTLRSAFAMILPKLDVERSLQDITDRVHEECDYGCELNNQLDFQEIWRGDPDIVIPRVYDEFCGDHVLVSEYIEGLRWEEMLAQCDAAQKNQYGQVIYRFVFGSLHNHGIFNGDPHPGNYLFLADGRVAFLDFGCVQRFQTKTVEAFLDVRQLARDGVRGEALRTAMTEAYGLPPTLDEEEWEFLEGYILLILAPGLQGVFRFDRTFTREVYKQTMRASTLFARKALSKGVWEAKRPGLVFLNRIQYGLYSILAALEAEADWSRLLGEGPDQDGPSDSGQP